VISGLVFEISLVTGDVDASQRRQIKKDEN
jgi:hypothetical protein